MDSQPLPKLYARSLRPVLICQLCHTYGTPYSTFRLRSLCVNVCLPRSSCVNGRLPNTLLTCQDVPGSHSAFLCRVKGHTLTSCARRRGSLGTRTHFGSSVSAISSGNGRLLPYTGCVYTAHARRSRCPV